MEDGGLSFASLADSGGWSSGSALSQVELFDILDEPRVDFAAVLGTASLNRSRSWHNMVMCIRMLRRRT